VLGNMQNLCGEIPGLLAGLTKTRIRHRPYMLAEMIKIQYLAIASRTNSSLPEITAPSGAPFTAPLTSWTSF